MIKRNFLGKDVSLLGYGTMRLPLTDPADAGSIDVAKTEKLLCRAMEGGINYFDTAAPYHNGNAERVLGDVLSQFDREKLYYADKFPGHQIFREYKPEETLRMQLKKCRTDYFDFYLFHNVFENSLATYEDPRWGIVDAFVQAKKEGRIRHLGFSTHGSLEIMRQFIERHGEHLDFCQIQLNYLDWTLQEGAAKVELLKRYGLPIVVMEPVRGGKLASLPSHWQKRLYKRRPISPAAWAFRFLQDVEGVGVILSGMSTPEQLEDNLTTFSQENPLSQEERELLFLLAEELKGAVPCTACGYCTATCPAGLDIPFLLSVLNDVSVVPSFNAAMRVELLPEGKKPEACLACGKCTKLCPQSIPIPDKLKLLSEKLKTIPSWRTISQEREAIQEKDLSE